MQAPNPQKAFFVSLSLLTHSLSLVPLSDTFAEPHLFKPPWHSQEGAGPSSNWSRDVRCSQGQQPPTVAWKCAQDFPWIVVDADAGACYVRDVRLGASLRPGGCAAVGRIMALGANEAGGLYAAMVM